MSGTLSTRYVLPRPWFVVAYVFAGLAVVAWLTTTVAGRILVASASSWLDANADELAFTFGSFIAAVGLSLAAVILGLVILATDRSRRALICLGVSVVAVALGVLLQMFV